MYTSRMARGMILDKTTTQGHALFLYSDAAERLAVIAQYFKQGLANNELCILVTADSKAVTVQNFKKIGFNVTESLKNKALRIFEMNATYLPNGQFVTDYMLSNVSSFIESAKEEGYNGLRTAGEMCWTKEHPEAVDDAIDYEHKVNGLAPAGSNFIGLCLYPMQDVYSKIIQGAVRSHPSFIYDGHIRSSPYYGAA